MTTPYKYYSLVTDVTFRKVFGEHMSNSLTRASPSICSNLSIPSTSSKATSTKGSASGTILTSLSTSTTPTGSSTDSKSSSPR